MLTFSPMSSNPAKLSPNSNNQTNRQLALQLNSIYSASNHSQNSKKTNNTVVSGQTKQESFKSTFVNFR